MNSVYAYFAGISSVYEFRSHLETGTKFVYVYHLNEIRSCVNWFEFRIHACNPASLGFSTFSMYGTPSALKFSIPISAFIITIDI